MKRKMRRKKNILSPAVISAIHKNDIPKIKKWLKNGGNVNSKTEDAWTPIMIASYWGRTSIVKLLLAKGADVYATDQDGNTALSLAHGEAFPDVIAVLNSKIESKEQVVRSTPLFSSGEEDTPGTNLTQFRFRWMDLRGADFTGANLEGAIFTGANLNKATFTGANLTNVTFTIKSIKDL